MENWNLQTLRSKPDNPTVQSWNIFKVIRVNHKPVYQPQTQLVSCLVPNHYFSHCLCSAAKTTANLLSTARNFDTSVGNG